MSFIRTKNISHYSYRSFCKLLYIHTCRSGFAYTCLCLYIKIYTNDKI
ncbi:hypothetical protein HanIR_Chr04g0191801 [Helianthus annuus]|nr:hypothetical protein HanIR_Chr04g0191801 [Helianthus annuus]